MNRVTMYSLLVISTAPMALSAQWNLARQAPGQTRMQATFGVDPAVIPALGVDRVVSMFGATTQLQVEAGAVAGKADLRDYRVRLGAQVQLVRSGALRIAGSATFVTRGTQNDIFTAIDFGSDFGLVGGFYRRGWFVAGEAGFDKAIVTHITHSAAYRERYYEDARDGWYLNNGGTWRFGVTSGVAVGRTEFNLRAGVPLGEGGEALMTPMYLSLGVGMAL